MSKLHPVWLCVLVGPRLRPYVFDVPLSSTQAAEKLWKSLATGYGFKEMQTYRTETAKRALKAFQADLKAQGYGSSKALKRLTRRK
jgi:hypothetical protein